MKEYDEKCKAVHNVAGAFFDSFVFATQDEKYSTVCVKGTMPDLLYLAHELIEDIRGKIIGQLGEEAADDLIGMVIKTTDELREEAENEIEKHEGEIPRWLKKLLELEEDDKE